MAAELIATLSAAVKHRRGIVERADTAAYGEWDEELPRGPSHDFEQGIARLCGSRDVEKDDFVGPGLAVRRCQFGGIAGVAQLYKLYAFDHAPAVDIKTGDDALGKRFTVHRTSPESSFQSRRISRDEIALRRDCRAPPRR